MPVTTPGIYEAALVGEDLGTMYSILGHALQNLGGLCQCYGLSRIVLQRDIPGAFVECGVAAGAQLAVMAKAMLREGKPRKIHAFDSFDGIPHAGPKDDQQAGLADFLMDRNLPLRDRLVTTNVARVPLSECEKLWKQWGWNKDIEVEWHQGWFQDTMPTANVGQIAFLRLDGDLYESTEVCLRYLYDSVAPGGLVFIDDYGLGGCFKATHEFRESRGITSLLMQDVEGNSGAAYWFK